MSDGFAKLHRSLLTSSVWSESKDVRILWITMMAMADAEGMVMSSVPGLARQANLSIAETEAALEVLMGPDPYSRTPDLDGRRVVEDEGGWRLVTYTKHRRRGSREQKLERDRERMRRKRAEENGSDSKGVANSRKTSPEVASGGDGSPGVVNVAQAEAEAEAEAEADGRAPPARTRGADPGGDRISTAGLLRQGYQQRYEQARGIPWLTSGRSWTHFEAAGAWCDQVTERQGGDVQAVVDRLLDGLFADPFARSKDYPPALLESQPGRLYDPPPDAHGTAPGVDEEELRDRARARRAERELAAIEARRGQ